MNFANFLVSWRAFVLLHISLCVLSPTVVSLTIKKRMVRQGRVIKDGQTVGVVDSRDATRILVVGGNGRVGGSTAKWLHKLSMNTTPLALILGGRSEQNFRDSRDRILGQLVQEGMSLPKNPIDFLRIDLDSSPSDLLAAVKASGAHCIVNTAGPFQQRTEPVLLEAAVALGLLYVDVCDEPPLCAKSKELSEHAAFNGCIAVVAGGIWPGASALMAAEAVTELRKLADCPIDRACEGEKVDLSFFTAGTGNAGATIVSATFLLLAQHALTYISGERVEKKPWSSPQEIDFGRGVGTRTVRLLDNPGDNSPFT